METRFVLEITVFLSPCSPHSAVWPPAPQTRTCAGCSPGVAASECPPPLSGLAYCRSTVEAATGTPEKVQFVGFWRGMGISE